MAKVELDIYAQIKDLQKGLNTTQAQLKDLQKQSDKTNKAMQSNMQQTSRIADDMKGALAGVFAVGTAVALAKSVINVRVEFEKFEAMLKVALGSAEAANREFEKIQQFASKTPFSVRELTDSFVRLVNQGFKPTTKEMKAMGDLAAAMGKEFIQLTEAIIDAQVGEFERLKEFGIRASKQGDEVTLSFKGVEKQVAFTQEAIRDAIVGFGEMEGVMGTMEEVSKTLGGQLSNLGDSLTTLANKLGEMASEDVSSGVAIIKNLADILSALADLQDKEGGGIVKVLGQIDDAISKYVPHLKPIGLIKQGVEALAGITGEASEALQEVVNDEIDLEEETEDTTQQIIIQEETLKTLQDRLKKLNEEKLGLSITDTVRIAEINRETDALKAQIEQLNKLGVALETKPLKLEDITIDQDEVFKMWDEMDKAEEDRYKRLNDNIYSIESEGVKNRLQLYIQEQQQKELISQGTVEAISAGLDLLGAVSKDNATAQQIIAVSQAIINGAVGITKTAAELGYPAAIPFQIALGLQTLAQIATIRQQKFAGGHYEVLGGDRHYQGGVNIGIGEAEQGEGVAVFSRQATQKYGKFLPAFVKAMNENEASVTGYGDNAYQISLDESGSVKELRNIQRLLNKPEIRYVNGFKIIERQGHIQRVKL